MLKCIFGGFWGCQLTGGASLLVEHVTGFDCLLSPIFEEGGLSITSVNMLQALPINITTFSKREHVALFLTGCCKSELARRRNHAARVL